MKMFIQKYGYLLGIIAFVSLRLPLSSVDEKTFRALFGDNGGYPEIPHTLNILQIVTHYLLFTKWMDMTPTQILILISFCTFCVMALTQIIVSILKNYTGMLYTAITLFITALSLYPFLLLRSNVIILYGYYIFLILQILLVLISYKSKTHAKNTTR